MSLPYDVTFNGQYGERLSIYLAEEDKEKYFGKLRRKSIPVVVETKEMETGKVVHSITTTTPQREDFGSIRLAAFRIAELLKADIPFVLEYIPDGRSGGYGATPLGSTEMWLLFKSVYEELQK